MTGGYLSLNLIASLEIKISSDNFSYFLANVSKFEYLSFILKVFFTLA